MLFLLTLLGVATLATAALENMGTCITVQTDESFVFDDFVKENNGHWSYVKIPVTREYCDVEKMYMDIKPSTIQKGGYDTTFYAKYEGSSSYRALIKGVTVDSLKGHVTAVALVGKEEVTFKISFLKYVAGRYAYYTICSDVGGNQNIDYRYVLANSALTDDEKKVIADFETKYAFKGELQDLSI